MSGVAIAKVQCGRFMCCERLPAYNVEYTKLFSAVAAGASIDELSPLIRSALKEQKLALNTSECGPS